MDENYDYVVLSTGLKECILCCLLSIEGNRVLQLDRNDYYGGKTASLTSLKALFDSFGVQCTFERFGDGRDWYVDLVPKFLMAGGNLVKLLVHTGALRYLEFKQVDGSFIFQSGGIHKVPSTDAEAISSGLMNVFEKRRFRKFLLWVMDVSVDDPNSWNSVYITPLDVKRDPITIAFTHFGLDESTQNFIGHSICLYSDDSYLRTGTAIEAVERMQLYSRSVFMYGKSSYIYPMYGLGDLAQSFARLSAVHGGTFMLRKPVDELVMENGKVVGVRSEDETVRCNAVICDPSYAPNLVKKVGQVVRAICLLSHPIPGISTSHSAQIIVPQSETGFKNDIYIFCVSHAHKVCPPGFFIVIVAKTVETSDPQTELKPGLDLLGSVDQVLFSVDDLHEPINDGRSNKVFISSSYDASTHLEGTCLDVLSLYERITGRTFDFSKITDLIARPTKSEEGTEK